LRGWAKIFDEPQTGISSIFCCSLTYGICHPFIVFSTSPVKNMNYETEYYMDGSFRNDKALWGTTTPAQPEGAVRSNQTNWGTTTQQVEPLIAERRQQTPGFWASLDRFLDDGWGLELLAWVISAIFMAAIIVTCVMNNGKSLANWPLSITINTLIS
jgi:hypothetical protein